MILVEVDGKCQFIDDKLNLTQSFYPGRDSGEKVGAEAGGKGKERMISECACLWLGGALVH